MTEELYKGSMTKEQYNTSENNRRKLRKKLGLIGKSNLVLHHLDTTMRHNDIERYIQWNEEDVVIMEKGEHTKLHYNEINTPENREKMGWKRGTGAPKDPPKQHSDESWRKNISEALKGRAGAAKGKFWFNNGEKETYAYECPEGFTKGRLKGALNGANKARLKRYAELTRKESVRAEG